MIENIVFTLIYTFLIVKISIIVNNNNKYKSNQVNLLTEIIDDKLLVINILDNS